jgi:putative SOS response-associated peptidase YedK
MINARAETIAEKPAFRDAFRYRRCLVPASGFYEWDRGARPRQPYYFHPAGEPFMAMAAVWEHWLHPGGSEILSAAIVTMPAAAPVARIHHRMPLILARRHWDAWLDTGSVKPDIAPFIQTAPEADFLAMHAVGTGVNRASNDSPELIQPARPESDDGGQLTLF